MVLLVFPTFYYLLTSPQTKLLNVAIHFAKDALDKRDTYIMGPLANVNILTFASGASLAQYRITCDQGNDLTWQEAYRHVW